MKNKIYGIEFCRGNDATKHYIILHLEKEIPPLGYGMKQIRKMLKKGTVQVKTCNFYRNLDDKPPQGPPGRMSI